MTNSSALPPSLPTAPVPRPPALALVVLVTDVAMPAAELARWKHVHPMAEWIAVNSRDALHPDGRTSLARRLTALTEQRRLRADQLVLLGRRDAGRLALDLVLEGTLACAGVVAVDIPCTPPGAAIAPAAASIRLVLHDDDADARSGLIDALRGADVDIRVMKLPSSGFDAEETTLRAASSFLFELIAIASSHRMNQGRFRHVF